MRRWVRVATLLLFVFVLFSACSHSSDKSTKNTPKHYPSSRDVRITELDIKQFVAHKRAIDAITADIDREIRNPRSGSTKTKSQLTAEGKKKIDQYLTSQGLDPVLYMRKSAKIIRAYFALTIYTEFNRQKSIKRIRKYAPTPEEAEKKIANLNNSWEEFRKQYSDGVRPEEMALIKKHIVELKKVM